MCTIQRNEETLSILKGRSTVLSLFLCFVNALFPSNKLNRNCTRNVKLTHRFWRENIQREKERKRDRQTHTHTQTHIHKHMLTGG